MPSIPSALRAISKTKHPAVRTAKRLATSIMQRIDVVIPARLTNGDMLYIDIANAVGRHIWLQGDYLGEAPITGLIQSILSPNDVFLDIGANVGFFSLLASRKVGDRGEVHSFEPLPQLASMIRRSAAANRVFNIHVVEAAVGQRTGVAEMASMKDSAYSHLLSGVPHFEVASGQWHALSVRTVCLDEYVESTIRKQPRLMKIDIEGAEVGALDGARSLLSHPSGPDVICEVQAKNLSRFGHTPSDVFTRFASMGYESLDPETGRPMGVADLSDHCYNVFFKKRSR